MTTRLGQWLVHGLFLAAFSTFMALSAGMVRAAPYAAMVIDARTGEVLHSENADTRLHPASLTKMMTLYIAFEAVERGEITLDTKVTVSKHAASEPPSKLGLKAGQKIALRHLIRAAAIKSGNDAATAIGEAIEGSEAAFGRRMTRTAKALGMTNTTFKNAHGLTQEGHLSTARDMTTMGRRLFYDYPQYYNLFSRRTADAGIAKVSSTNARFLSSYKGADGIKTGYTSAAGFNLTASAERGDKRIIATVFGGRSTAQRNAKVAELLDLGFGKAPKRAPTHKPSAPVYVAEAPGSSGAKTIRVSGAVKASIRPVARPGAAVAEPPEELLLAMQDDINAVLAQVQQGAAPAPAPTASAVDATAVVADAVSEIADSAVSAALETAAEPLPEGRDIAFVAAPPARPEVVGDIQQAAAAPVAAGFVQQSEVQPETLALAEAMRADMSDPETAAISPRDGSDQIILAAVSPDAAASAAQELEVVSRVSTSGGRQFGINIGKYDSRYQAERILLQTALIEMSTLDEALRKVVTRSGGYDANFVGLTQETAELACRRLTARNTECSVIGY